MIISAWRLVRAARADDAFSGEGARLYGGRWNPPGCRATYLSATRSLAALEVLVHQADRVPTGRFFFFEVRFSEALLSIIKPSELDSDWRSFPPRLSTMLRGRDWIRQNGSPVLRVPSVLIPDESNYIINPEHPRAQEISVGKRAPFVFDGRFRESTT